MKSTPQGAETQRFLTGWKEIANYLGKGVRTVQRYEREMDFPVRRPAGKSHAAVIATTVEVDAWVAASPIQKEFRLSRPQNSVQNAVLNDIRERKERMGALRGQMAALQTELRASILKLAESIEGLYGELNNHWGLTGARGTSYPELLSSDDENALKVLNDYTPAKYTPRRKSM